MWSQGQRIGSLCALLLARSFASVKCVFHKRLLYLIPQSGSLTKQVHGRAFALSGFDSFQTEEQRKRRGRGGCDWIREKGETQREEKRCTERGRRNRTLPTYCPTPRYNPTHVTDHLSCDLITVICLKFMIHDSVQLFLIFPPSLSPILSSFSSVSFIKQCKVKERRFSTVLRRFFENPGFILQSIRLVGH